MGAPTRIPWKSLGKLGSLPDNGVWFHESCDPHQFLDASWGQPAPVPHLRLTLVDINVCVALELFFHCNHPVWAADDNNVVQESENFLIVAETPLDCLQCGVLSQGKQQWHEGVALLPSFSLWELHPPTNKSTSFRKSTGQMGGSDLRSPSSEVLATWRSWRSDRTPRPHRWTQWSHCRPDL